MLNIRVGDYGMYSGEYRGPTMLVEVGEIRLWYSYETIVAFAAPGYGKVVSENIWSKTTGKHLNWIDPYKDSRTPNEEFERLKREMLESYQLKKMDIADKYNKDSGKWKETTSAVV